MQATATKAASQDHKRQLFFSLGVAGVFLALWLCITWATKLAGGNAHYSVGQTLSNLGVAIVHDGGLIPWHWVGATTVVTGLFWTILVIMAGAVGLAVYAIVRAQRGGSSVFAWKSQSDNKLQTHTDLVKNRSQIKPLLNGHRPGAFFLGQFRKEDLYTDTETSILVIGPTRSGKTVATVVPNVLAHDGPVLCTSTKDDVLKLTAGSRQHVGPVSIYDPAGELEGEYETATWSLLSECTDYDKCIEVSKWAAESLAAGKEGGGNNDWQHWADKSSVLLSAYFFTAAKTGHSIVDVHDWVNNGVDGIEPTRQMLLQVALECDPDEIKRAMGDFEASAKTAGKEAQSFFSTTGRILKVYRHRAVRESAATSQLNIHTFLKRKGTLYLVTPSKNPEQVASLFITLVHAVIAEAQHTARREDGGRLKFPLLLALDELANVCPIRNLSNIASTGAGQGILIMSIIQNVSQLTQVYGQHDSDTIKANHPCKLILPNVSDEATANYVGGICGKKKSIETSSSRSHNDGNSPGSSSVSYQSREEVIVTPDALRRLSPWSQICVFRSLDPLHCTMVPYWRDERFAAMSAIEYENGCIYQGEAGGHGSVHLAPVKSNLTQRIKRRFF